MVLITRDHSDVVRRCHNILDEEQVCHKLESVVNAGLVDHFLLNNDFFDFGLLHVFSLVVGVALDVKFNEGLELANFGLELVLVLNHFFLGIIRLDLSLFDLLFKSDNFVELFLLVAELSALGGDEEILGGGEVELELVVVVLLVLLLLVGFVVGAHVC